MLLIALFVASLALASPALATSTERIISSHGVQVVVPPGWQRVQAASAGPVTDPSTLLVVGTAGVRPKASRCQIAAYRLPPRASVVVVVGWQRLGLSGA
jgi:hypothetical protein